MKAILTCLLIAGHICAAYKYYKRETSWDGKPYLKDVNKELNAEGSEDPESFLGSLVVDLHKCDSHLKNGKDTLSSLVCEKKELQRLLLIALAHGEHLSKQIARLDQQHDALLQLIKNEMVFEEQPAEEKKPTPAAAKEKVMYHYRFGEALPVVTVEKQN